MSYVQSYGGESVNERGLDSCGINWAPGRMIRTKGESNHTKVSAESADEFQSCQYKEENRGMCAVGMAQIW
jgi:hypothetical protein